MRRHEHLDLAGAARPQRGTLAFEALGLLQGIQGVLVHDGLASYKGLDCTHSLCNAHHIRELVYIHEQENEKIWDPWAQEMIDLLLQALGEVDLTGGPLIEPRQAWFEARWSTLLERAEALNPQAQRTGTSQDAGLGSRGRLKQSKAANLLKRLRLSPPGGVAFHDGGGCTVHQQPGGTGIAHGQGQANISGCFRIEHGAATFFNAERLGPIAASATELLLRKLAC